MAPQRKTFPRLFLARSEPYRLVGERVYLRPPERGDYEEWASLRARSRNFLSPWEPSSPPDGLSRSSYRARLARYGEDWRTDQGYNFFVYHSDDALVGGIGLSNLRRGVAETALGYWVGEPYARQRLMTAALPLVLDFAFDRLRLHRIRLPACRPTYRAAPCCCAPASSRRATPAATCRSTASGRTTCSSRSFAKIGGVDALAFGRQVPARPAKSSASK